MTSDCIAFLNYYHMIKHVVKFVPTSNGKTPPKRTHLHQVMNYKCGLPCL